MAENIFSYKDESGAIKKDFVYTPVNWEDGVTPLDDDRLNISDKALNDLLGFNPDTENSEGYIFQIVDKVKSTEDELTAVKNSVATVDTNLTKVTSSVTTLTEDVDSLEGNLNSLKGGLPDNVSVNSVYNATTQLTTDLLTLAGVEKLSALDGVSVKSLKDTVDNLTGGESSDFIKSGETIMINCGNAQNLI